MEQPGVWSARLLLFSRGLCEEEEEINDRKDCPLVQLIFKNNYKILVQYGIIDRTWIHGDIWRG